MRFETDAEERVDVDVQSMLNVLTDAGKELAEMLPRAIVCMAKQDNDLIVRWKEAAHPLFRDAVNKAWRTSPLCTGRIIHEESPT